ncbi:MAG: regulatory protein RecX [Steroidobacteraceae bacterium]
MAFGKKRKPVDRASLADPQAARSAAIALLARRDFSTGELRERLARKGFEAGIVAQVIAELGEERALDDSRYAANYVRYAAARGHGPVRIRAELKALELTDELIEAALAEGPDWQTSAREARVRKFGPEPPVGWPEKARQARFLQYRGFSSDHIRLALDADFDLD